MPSVDGSMSGRLQLHSIRAPDPPVPSDCAEAMGVAPFEIRVKNRAMTTALMERAAVTVMRGLRNKGPVSGVLEQSKDLGFQAVRILALSSI